MKRKSCLKAPSRGGGSGLNQGATGYDGRGSIHLLSGSF